MHSSIIKATKGDCKEISNIYNRYLGKATMDLEYKSHLYFEDILLTQDDMEELWVIKEDEIRCWGIIKKYSDRAGYRLTGETSVYCHPNFINRGYGTTLKIHLMERCRALGYHHLLARIFSTNEVSINYNIKLGYTIVGVQNEIGQIDGKWQDVTVMQCIL